MTRVRAMVTLGAWLVLSVSLAATDARPAVIVVGGIVAVAAAVILVMLDLSNAISRVEWTQRRQVHLSSRGSDPRVGSLHRELYQARWFGSTELRDTLVGLVNDRLLAHRHIDGITDPAAAMEVLTPSLRGLVASPRRPGTSVGELDRILTDIEAL